MALHIHSVSFCQKKAKKITEAVCNHVKKNLQDKGDRLALIVFLPRFLDATSSTMLGK